MHELITLKSLHPAVYRRKCEQSILLERRPVRGTAGRIGENARKKGRVIDHPAYLIKTELREAAPAYLIYLTDLSWVPTT